MLRPRGGSARRLLAAACALFAGTATLTTPPAEGRELATARMSATIEQPLSIIDADDMDFGRITPRGTAGTVVLTPAASAQCTVTGGLLHTGNCRAATFEGKGTFLSQLRAKRPNGNSITLQGPPGATMQLDNFSFGAGSGLLDLGQNGVNHRFMLLSIDGSYAFYVGGTLHVAAAQTPGVYTGTFEIQIAYN